MYVLKIKYLHYVHSKIAKCFILYVHIYVYLYIENIKTYVYFVIWFEHGIPIINGTHEKKCVQYIYMYNESTVDR